MRGDVKHDMFGIEHRLDMAMVMYDRMQSIGMYALELTCKYMIVCLALNETGTTATWAVQIKMVNMSGNMSATVVNML